MIGSWLKAFPVFLGADDLMLQEYGFDDSN